MNKIILTSFFTALLILAGCDYNDKYFDGLDDIEIIDIVDYEGEYTGDYPSEGYFTDRASLESAVASMLEEILPYADAGSIASISSILYGEITPGYEQIVPDVEYELVTADYQAMGAESGQPGKYNNFDSSMDVEAYLIAFIANKYPDLAIGDIVAITYIYYSGGNTTRISMYQRTSSGWETVQAFVPDIDYTLTTEDYASMGTGANEPGQYNNFSSSIDPEHYLPVFMNLKFPYAQEGTTGEVSYAYYDSGSTTTESMYFRFNGATWAVYDPFADTVEITSMVASMAFDGENWTLERLMGGVVTYTMTYDDYNIIYRWVEENHPDYLSSVRSEEFYIGASIAYSNMTYAYSSWRQYNEELANAETDEIDAVQDERFVWAMTTLVLPVIYPEPDPGLTYIIVYTVYSGRGSGDYKISFVYNSETEEFEAINTPTVA